MKKAGGYAGLFFARPLLDLLRNTLLPDLLLPSAAPLPFRSISYS
ncbi:MAG: hypothetical protein AAGG11_22250 [Pseudomonadota bacterium]